MKKILLRIAVVIFFICFLLFLTHMYRGVTRNDEKIKAIIETDEELAQKALKEGKLLLLMTSKIVELNSRITALEATNNQLTAKEKKLEKELEKVRKAQEELSQEEEEYAPVPNLKTLIPIGDE